MKRRSLLEMLSDSPSLVADQTDSQDSFIGRPPKVPLVAVAEGVSVNRRLSVLKCPSWRLGVMKAESGAGAVASAAARSSPL